MSDHCHAELRRNQEYSGGAERTRGATLVSDGGPVQSGLVSASPSRIVELFHFGRGECAKNIKGRAKGTWPSARPFPTTPEAAAVGSPDLA